MTAGGAICTVTGVTCVVVHQPSAFFLGCGLVLVDRPQALEFADVEVAQAFLDRHACEPGFVAMPLVRRHPAAALDCGVVNDRIDACRTA
jgi:hypothetical protein